MEEQNTSMNFDNQSLSKLTISKTAVNYLSETGKWTNFLSILGFIFAGLIILMGLFAGSMMSMMTNGQTDLLPSGMGFLFGGMYILMGLLYFFPAWYLSKFARKLKLALSTKNEDELNTAFSNQKSFYKFWGILSIIVIGIYILTGLFTLIIAIST